MSTIESINKLKNLIAYETQVFENGEFEDYNKEYDNLSGRSIVEMNNILRKFYNIDDHVSTYKDIKNIQNNNIILEKINYILLLKRTNLDLKDHLFQYITKRIVIVENIEKEIRKIFLELLDNHIKSSNKMSNDYLETINKISDNIKYKYYHQENIQEIEKNAFYNFIYEEYINNMINIIAKTILEYTDEELEVDQIYAKVILYQILLRSFLSLSNNYEYNIESNDNILSKSIVKNAFISNNDDNLVYNKIKEKKNE